MRESTDTMLINPPDDPIVWGATPKGLKYVVSGGRRIPTSEFALTKETLAQVLFIYTKNATLQSRRAFLKYFGWCPKCELPPDPCPHCKGPHRCSPKP